MKEVTDQQELEKIRMAVRNAAIIQDPNIMVTFHRAYTIGIEGIYCVELSFYAQIPLNGLLLMDRCEFYPSLQAIMILTIQEMERQLDAFNSGKHWRYKGL